MRGPNPPSAPCTSRSARQAELKADPAFHDLSGIFADEKKLVFIDYCHTTESANARIAEQMAAAVLGWSHEQMRPTVGRGQELKSCRARKKGPPGRPSGPRGPFFQE